MGEKQLSLRGEATTNFQRIKAYIKGGGTYIELAETLAKEGYVNRRGNPVTKVDIAGFMRNRGFRTYSRKTHTHRAGKVVRATRTPCREDLSENLLTVMAIAEKNGLSENMKIRLIKATLTP